jgi:hypothetical protein
MSTEEGSESFYDVGFWQYGVRRWCTHVMSSRDTWLNVYLPNSRHFHFYFFSALVLTLTLTP